MAKTAGKPAFAKVECVKCKKYETPHASKQCGMCHSNDSKYKRRKDVHRKKQEQARCCLQASSRQAVQERAPATATPRPLNLSTMAATSTGGSQPSRTCSQAGMPLVAKIIHSVIAQLQAFNQMSAIQCGAVVRCVTSAYPGKSNDGMVPQDISCKTVHQSIVEGGIVCDLKVAEWMASSSSLFIGIICKHPGGKKKETWRSVLMCLALHMFIKHVDT